MITQCFFISFFYFGHYCKIKLQKTLAVTCTACIFLLLNLSIAVFNPQSALFAAQNSYPGYSRGILYYILLVVGCLWSYIGIAIIILNVERGNEKAFLSYLALCLASITFAVYYLIQCRIFTLSIDPTSLIALLIFTGLFLGIYKMGFFETLSHALLQSLELFSEAVAVFDRKCNIIYCNNAFKDLGQAAVDNLSLEFEKILAGSNRNIRDTIAFEITIPGSSKILSLSIRPYRKRFQIAGTYYICIFHDDTELQISIKSLREKNDYLSELNQNAHAMAEKVKNLAAIEERSRLAKEMHDILGHSLVLALSIMESNRLIIAENPGMSITRLKQAVDEIDAGFREIHEINSGKETVREDFHSFYGQLSGMAEKLSTTGVMIELASIDDISGCDALIFTTIYRICQESVTNAIKHGKATHILISIKRCAENAVVYIVNDGAGCPSFEKGNGTSSMEERVKIIGGQICFSSFEDQKGFMVQATIPLAGPIFLV